MLSRALQFSCQALLGWLACERAIGSHRDAPRTATMHVTALHLGNPLRVEPLRVQPKYEQHPFEGPPVHGFRARAGCFRFGWDCWSVEAGPGCDLPLRLERPSFTKHSRGVQVRVENYPSLQQVPDELRSGECRRSITD